MKATTTTNIITALSQLGRSESLDDNVFLKIEELVCRIYAPKSNHKTVSELRWAMFKKNQSLSESMPPTRDSLMQAVLRAHYQCMIWKNDLTANQIILSPSECGWKWEDDKWVEIMMKNLPAPDTILSLVKCNCEKAKCSTYHCSCRQVALYCTELCGYDANEDT